MATPKICRTVGLGHGFDIRAVKAEIAGGGNREGFPGPYGTGILRGFSPAIRAGPWMASLSREFHVAPPSSCRSRGVHCDGPAEYRTWAGPQRFSGVPRADADTSGRAGTAVRRERDGRAGDIGGGARAIRH